MKPNLKTNLTVLRALCLFLDRQKRFDAAVRGRCEISFEAVVVVADARRSQNDDVVVAKSGNVDDLRRQRQRRCRRRRDAAGVVGCQETDAQFGPKVSEDERHSRYFLLEVDARSFSFS